MAAVYSLSAPTAPPQRQVTPAQQGERQKAKGESLTPDTLNNQQPETKNQKPKTSHQPPATKLKLPTVKALAAILIDAESGQVLYQKNAHLRRPMASTTKIMTGLLLCENLLDTDIITASQRAASTPESSLNLKTGEKLTARDMLTALMLRSANDGCVAVAEHIAGTEAAFAEMMNKRAEQIGAVDTHFVNSHGLHDPNHYTTAADLAMIARVAMQNERFAGTVCMKRCQIDRSIVKQDLWMKNHSRFLGKFPGADGIKTGWTNPAGRCYVGSATYGGWRIISVVLKSPDYVDDTRALMKFGFDYFRPEVVAKAGESAGVCSVRAGEKESVPVVVKNRVQVVLRKGVSQTIETTRQMDDVTAPITPGMTVGSLNAVVDGRVVASSPLIAAEAVAPVAAQGGVVSSGGIWKNTLSVASILAVCLVSLRYGTRKRFRIAALAQSARRRWRRLQKSLRGDDRRRTSLRQRQEDHYPRVEGRPGER
jgi:serine-type D-Ala-D-Ala carboxypeptidase (penicillin-binding protein 5/6)